VLGRQPDRLRPGAMLCAARFESHECRYGPRAFWTRKIRKSRVGWHDRFGRRNPLGLGAKRRRVRKRRPRRPSCSPKPRPADRSNFVRLTLPALGGARDKGLGLEEWGENRDREHNRGVLPEHHIPNPSAAMSPAPTIYNVASHQVVRERQTALFGRFSKVGRIESSMTTFTRSGGRQGWLERGEAKAREYRGRSRAIQSPTGSRDADEGRQRRSSKSDRAGPRHLSACDCGARCRRTLHRRSVLAMKQRIGLKKFSDRSYLPDAAEA